MKIDKFCSNCKTKLGRHKYKYCSLKCQGQHKKEQWIISWKAGNIKGYVGKTLQVAPTLRKYLFAKYSNKCCKCGWSTLNTATGRCPLEVNHIDGDASNCVESNLELICPNCHSLTHNFRNLNRKSKRKRNIIPSTQPKVVTEPKKIKEEKTYPSKEELEALIWKMPMSSIAKKYGISDNGVKKWCKKKGIISFPGRGYWMKNPLQK